MNAASRVSLSEGFESCVTRPVIPPLLTLALACWASSAICFSFLRVWATSLGEVQACALSAIFAITALGIVFSGLRSKRSARVCALGVVLGLALSFGGFVSYAHDTSAAKDFHVTKMVLLEDARTSSYGASAPCRAYDLEGRSVIVQAYLSESCCCLLRGAQLAVEGSVSAYEGLPSEYAWGRGEVGSVRVEYAERLRGSGLIEPILALRERAVLGLQEAGEGRYAFVEALACGYVRSIEANGAYDDFKVTGLAHLVAVSGSHLAIVVAFVQAAMVRLGAGPVLRGAGASAFIVAYLVFSGLAVSAVRSAVMAVVGLCSVLGARRSSSLNAAGVCLLLFLSVDPRSCTSASLVLSAGSTLGIIMFSGLFASWFGKVPRPLEGAVEAVSLTSAASLVTQPYSAALFSQLPLLALLANVLVVPLFAPVCMLSLLAALGMGLSLPFAGEVAYCAWLACEPMQAIVRALASIPYACVPVSLPAWLGIAFSVGAAYALWRFWPQLDAVRLAQLLAVSACACSLAAVLLCFAASQKEQLVVLDVGQGDAFLVRSRGSAMLVDTGTNDAMLREELAHCGVVSLDAVLITHGDDDHCGSLNALASVVKIDSILLAEGVRDCNCEACVNLRDTSDNLRGSPEIRYLAAGDAILCGSFTFEVLWPREFADEGGNADSVCLYGEWRRSKSSEETSAWDVLLTGDLEADELSKVVAERDVSDIDILKVGHHGARASLDEALAEALSPRIALIGVGAENRYGHPSEEVLALLDAQGALVGRTDVHGTVILDFSEEEICVDVERGGASGTMAP